MALDGIRPAVLKAKQHQQKKQETRDFNIHGVLAQWAYLASLSSTDDGGCSLSERKK